MNGFNLSNSQQRKFSLNQIKIDKKFPLKSLNQILQENQFTFLIFGLKADESQKNIYIKELLRQILNSYSLGDLSFQNREIRIKMEKQDLQVQFDYEKIQREKLTIQKILDFANKLNFKNNDFKSNFRKLIIKRVHSKPI
ncbi:unnamed protein product [Paramecium sonneborni]|uniref:Uncharacterized protein n=1 Tax=Paramecium sonneborni TaxID=65129 RepID=A0A8S1LI58_9CILI|nr:unnamed protein product [Paramecium sonneborni]